MSMFKIGWSSASSVGSIVIPCKIKRHLDANGRRRSLTNEVGSILPEEVGLQSQGVENDKARRTKRLMNI